MKLDFICEFDIKFCYRSQCNNNWIVKHKPIITDFDKVVITDYAWEKETKDYQGYGIRNQVSKHFYQQMRITAKNIDDEDLIWYSYYCLRNFNEQFMNQKQVDEYFGRV